MSNIIEKIAGETEEWPMSANTMRSISLLSAGLAGGDLIVSAITISKAFNDPNIQMFFGKIGTPVMSVLGVCAAATVAVVFSKVAARKAVEESIVEANFETQSSVRRNATESVSNPPDAKPL